MGTIKQFYALPLSVWETAAEEVDPIKRWKIISSVADYAFYGKEPDALKGVAKIVFALQKPIIDKSRNKSRFGNKNANKTQNERKQNANKTQKNAPLNENENENKTENETPIAPAGAGESVTAEAIYRAYPARGRKFFADTLKAVMSEARSYAEAHDVSVADALAYMLSQTQLFASIAGRSRYVSRSDQFFSQGDWQGDAEQWRAQFDDGDDDGEETPIDREEQVRQWREQYKRDRAAADGDTTTGELPPETVAMFARMQAENARLEAEADKICEETAK